MGIIYGYMELFTQVYGIIYPGIWKIYIVCELSTIYPGIWGFSMGIFHPSSHPFFLMDFPEQNHPAMIRGTPMTLDTSICR